MKNNNKMLLFDNPKDFLNFMDYLQKEYNKQKKENKPVKKENKKIIVSGGGLIE